MACKGKSVDDNSGIGGDVGVVCNGSAMVKG